MPNVGLTRCPSTIKVTEGSVSPGTQLPGGGTVPRGSVAAVAEPGVGADGLLVHAASSATQLTEVIRRRIGIKEGTPQGCPGRAQPWAP